MNTVYICFSIPFFRKVISLLFFPESFLFFFSQKFFLDFLCYLSKKVSLYLGFSQKRFFFFLGFPGNVFSFSFFSCTLCVRVGCFFPIWVYQPILVSWLRETHRQLEGGGGLPDFLTSCHTVKKAAKLS